MNITKKGAIDIISEVLELTKKEAEGFMENVDKVIEGLSKSMEVNAQDKECKVKLGKYISVNKKLVDERERLNPQNKEKFTVPTHEEMTIKRTKQLKDMK